jgi:hypothetical protein
MEKKYFNIIFYFVFFSLYFTACSGGLKPTPPKDYVTFNIKDVIIGGTNEFILENNEKASKINMFEFKVTRIFDSYEFILSEGLILRNNSLKFASKNQLEKDYTYKVNLDLVKEVTHEIDGEKRKVYAFDLYNYSTTRLFIKDGSPFEDINYIYRFNYNQPAERPDGYTTLTLKTNTYNEIVLKYDLYTSSSGNGINDFKFSGEQVFIENSKPSILFNYNAEWNNLSKGNNNYSNFNGNKINIVFMADGYSDRWLPSVLFDFHDDVRDNLMKEIKESNIKTKWDDINILALQTVSLDDKYNICGINNTNPYGDIDRIKKAIQTSFFGSPISIRDSDGETNVDVVIIVSTKVGTSYMTTDSSCLSKKGRKNKLVHIIFYPQSRYYSVGKSLTEHLKSALPEIY